VFHRWPDAHKAGKARHAFVSQFAIGVSDPLAHGWWVFSLCVRKSSAEFEAQPLRCFHPQGTKTLSVLALAGFMANHLRFGICVWFGFQHIGCATTLVQATATVQHQTFATRLHGLV